MPFKLAVIISCVFLANAQCQDSQPLQDTTTRTYRHLVLGFSFEYHPDYEFFDDSYPVAREQWKRRFDRRLGLSFLSPIPYKSQWTRRTFWLWRPATDSVLTLFFGDGVTIQIYRTSMSFPEIACTEGFQQYQNDTSEALPRFLESDPLPEHISDSDWVLVGLSGMNAEAQLLNGNSWKGLRGQSDTRVALPEQNTTCMADLYISFLICTTHSGGNIVFLFRQDPFNEGDDPVSRKEQRLSEAGFYDLVASVGWATK
jgi:hypothetical protein